MQKRLTDVSKAAALIKQGHPVAIPTETVYGLAASINNPDCIREVFKIKNRPLDNPLIVHLSEVDQIERFCIALPDQFKQLANAFWPGPLTVVLPILQNSLHPLVTANQETAAFRIPDHPLTLKLIAEVGPLVAPSANRSGYPSPTRVAHILNDYKQQVPVLEGGPCKQGLESTIIGFLDNDWLLLREGALSYKAIEKVLNCPLKKDRSSEKVPGKKYRHYSPNCKLHLVFTGDTFGKNILGFDRLEYPSSATVIRWGKQDNLLELQYRLYDLLRKLDQLGWEEAWIDCRFFSPSQHAALLDRLTKASFNHHIHIV